MNKKAFTLAEVLITLTIIGVIAAITIPNLMKKWEDHHTVFAVKEAYSIIDNAIKAAVRENGPMEDWNWTGDKNVYFVKQLLPYFKNAAYCAPGSYLKNVPCVASLDTLDNYWGDRKQLNGTIQQSKAKAYPSIRLANGMLLMNIVIKNIPASSKDGTIGELVVDINGKKGPTRYGYDTFNFGFGNNGFILNSERSNTGTLAYPRDHCQAPTASGWSCGRYIMLKGNVDYKYKSVGWW